MMFITAVLIFIQQVDISGYIETRPYVFWSDTVNITGYNRGWLECRSDGDNVGAHCVFDLLIPYDTFTISNASDYVDISRLALWLGPENLRVVAGKQRLYWGVGRVFRPLDVFNQVNFVEPGYERPGSNAILAYAGFGSMSSVRIVFRPDYNLENSFVAGRVGSHVVKNDIGLTLMHCSSEKKTILGGELAGEFGIGYWCEYTFTWKDTIDYSMFTIGIDYSFPLRIYCMTEFFFDGTGVERTDDYNFNLIFSGERITLAQRYLYASVGTIPDPFAVLHPRLSTLVNLDDRSFVLLPQIEMSFFENADITVGVACYIGAAESEFANVTPYDGAAYVWARVYF